MAGGWGAVFFLTLSDFHMHCLLKWRGDIRLGSSFTIQYKKHLKVADLFLCKQ